MGLRRRCAYLGLALSLARLAAALSLAIVLSALLVNAVALSVLSACLRRCWRKCLAQDVFMPDAGAAIGALILWLSGSDYPLAHPRMDGGSTGSVTVRHRRAAAPGAPPAP